MQYDVELLTVLRASDQFRYFCLDLMKIDGRIMGLAPCSRYCPEMLDRMR